MFNKYNKMLKKNEKGEFEDIFSISYKSGGNGIHRYYKNKLAIDEDGIPFTYKMYNDILVNTFSAHIKTVGLASNIISIESNCKIETNGSLSNSISTSRDSVVCTKGDHSHAIALGKNSVAKVTDKNSIACSLAPGSWVSGKKDSWIILADWRINKNNNHILNSIYTAKVGTDKIDGELIQEGKKYSFDKYGELMIKDANDPFDEL